MESRSVVVFNGRFRIVCDLLCHGCAILILWDIGIFTSHRYRHMYITPSALRNAVLSAGVVCCTALAPLNACTRHLSTTDHGQMTMDVIQYGFSFLPAHGHDHAADPLARRKKPTEFPGCLLRIEDPNPPRSVH